MKILTFPYINVFCISILSNIALFLCDIFNYTTRVEVSDTLKLVIQASGMFKACQDCYCNSYCATAIGSWIKSHGHTEVTVHLDLSKSNFS